MSTAATRNTLLATPRTLGTHVFWLALGLILLAGCSSARGEENGSAELSPSTSSITTTSSTTTTAAPTTTTTTLAPPLELDEVPRVARTTTDVVVPVLDEVDGGLLVRTPCQNSVVVVGAESTDRVHVVLDPGHGGRETGAVSPDGVVEKDVNLEVALQAEELLEQQGFAVTLTRYTDIRVPLVSRVEIADNLEAGLLVSIHYQASDEFPISDEPGTEVFYQRESEESKRIAGLIVEESLQVLGEFDIDWFAGQDAGAVYRLNADTGTDFYGMIRLPETPAVLAEMGFLGNEAEVALMRSGEMQEAAALALSNAIVRYFSTDDPGAGFVEPTFELLSAGRGGGLSGCEDPDLGETIEVDDELIEEPAEDG